MEVKMNVFIINKNLLYLGATLASVMILPFPSYALCTITDVSHSLSVRDISSLSSNYKFIDNNSEYCEHRSIRRSLPEHFTYSVLEEEKEYFYDKEYLYHQDCYYKDSPFGVSGLIITNNLTYPFNNYNSLNKHLWSNSLGFFNAYSFGGSCVLSIYYF